MHARDVAAWIGFDQTSTNVQASRVDKTSAFKDGVVGGATADIDIDDAPHFAKRQVTGAGAMARDDRFEMRARGSHDKVAK